MFRIGIVIAVLGGMLGYYGFSEYRLGSGASTTPQTITCGDLIKSGVGTNAHVAVTDCFPAFHRVVFQKKRIARSIPASGCRLCPPIPSSCGSCCKPSHPRARRF